MHSMYHQYLEWCLHKYFRAYRVVRPDIIDGGTEWFLLGADQFLLGTWKVRMAMNVLFKDVSEDPLIKNKKKQNYEERTSYGRCIKIKSSLDKKKSKLTILLDKLINKRS